jgi:hypothetical protein
VLKAISQRWYQIVLQRCALPTIDDLLLLAGDGIKICKEAEKMPAVKQLHQESDNSGKTPHIHGHHWGVIGILAGWVKKRFCVPLCASCMKGKPTSVGCKTKQIRFSTVAPRSVSLL